MTALEVHHLFNQPISDHCFSRDRSLLAVGRDSDVNVYERAGKGYDLVDTLSGHDKLVTGVDIAPSSGRIVTCAQDRNAYVWEKNASGWKPTLVLLRTDRAATCVRWSPSGDKFAVGSGARAIAICYFEQENDWWISKHIKKSIKSTVTSLSWHPNSVLLAGGTADAHTRIYSGFIKGIDTKPPDSVWGERLPFSTLCAEYAAPSYGRIHACAFSPSGNAVAFAAHDSTLTIVYPQGPELPPAAIITISANSLPFCAILWNKENEITAAGYDCGTYRCSGNEQGWQVHEPTAAISAKTVAGALQDSALNLFRQLDLRGANQNDTHLNTVHQNTISTIRANATSNTPLQEMSTSGADGRVVIWKL